SGVTMLEEAAELLERIRRNGLLPILVIDDSDSWLNVAGVDRRPLVAAFFGRVVRAIADFPCGLVVAVHHDYLAMDGYRQAAGFLETTIRVPSLGDDPAAGIGRILSHRLEVHDLAGELGNVIDNDVILALARSYAGPATKSLRSILLLV